jgi:hypothetical protein
MALTALARVHAEIAAAEEAKLLSSLIKFEESRKHLPYFVATIKVSVCTHQVPIYLPGLCQKRGK